MTSSAGAKPLRVGLLWHSVRAPNLGVGALTLANMDVARRAAAKLNLVPEFTVIGVGNEARSYAPDDVSDCFTIDRRFLLSNKGYRSELRRLDCLLDIGAGDSFADIYGIKRFTFLWLTKAMAIAAGKPLLLSPQTIGPFNGVAPRRLAAWAMMRSNLVVARDPKSMEAIRALAPGAKALQSVDVAFALPYAPQKRGGGRPRIGLNVSGMLFNEATSRRNRYGLGYDYAELSRALLRHLLANSRFEVELITHVSAPEQSIDDDGAVADRLASEFPGARRVPAFASPSDAKSHISGLDFLIAGRMHACIAAFSSGVPFVATAYSRKFDGLFGMLDYPAVLPRQGSGTTESVARVLHQLEQREGLAAAIEQGNRKVGALLQSYEDSLVDFFAQALERR